MTEYQFECSQDIDTAIQTINTHGIILVRDYLDRSSLERMSASFSALFEGKHEPCIIKNSGHPSNPEGRQILFDPKIAATEGMSEFADIFHSGFVKEFAEAYFAPNEFVLNPKILLTHLKPAEIPILPWHFDRIQSLKFWIYVKDATKKDGAFEYCPGTHWEGRYRANYHMATGTPVRKIPNDIPDYRVQNPITVEAKAGDLIVFDPDGFHRGGVVSPGHERLVIRADTFPKPNRFYSDKPLTPGWFATSPLNLSKFLKSSVSRRLGKRTLDQTQNREVGK